MKLLSAAFLAVFLLGMLFPGLADRAGAHIAFDLYGPGVRNHTYHHLPHFMSPYYYSSRPHHHHHHHAKTKHGGACETWHQRCAANWGHGNADYLGCLKFHGCR